MSSVAERRAARAEGRASLREAARDALQLLADATAALSGTPLESEGQRLSYLMAVTAMRSLWAAWELMAQGYHVQAATVLRSALEYWAAAVYLWQRPEGALPWLAASPRQRPAPQELAAALPRPSARRWRRSYRRLSQVAQPRLRALLAALEEAHHDPLKEGGGAAQAEAVAAEAGSTALAMLETVPLLARAVEREPALKGRLQALRQRLQEALSD
jgi:hypothetical protein